MKSNNSTIWLTSGKIILGLIIIVFVALLILLIKDNASDISPSFAIRLTFLIFPLIIFMVGFFLVRKHPILVGATFLGIGVIYTKWWQLFLIKDAYIGFLIPFIGCPMVMFTMLDGFLFLLSGVTGRRKEVIHEVQVIEPISTSPEPKNKLPKIDIGVITIVIASLSVLDFFSLVLTIDFGGNLPLFLLFWGLWPIISVVGFIVGLVGIVLHHNKAVIGTLIDVFQMVILSVFWGLMIFAFS